MTAAEDEFERLRDQLDRALAAGEEATREAERWKAAYQGAQADFWELVGEANRGLDRVEQARRR